MHEGVIAWFPTRPVRPVKPVTPSKPDTSDTARFHGDNRCPARRVRAFLPRGVAKEVCSPRGGTVPPHVGGVVRRVLAPRAMRVLAVAFTGSVLVAVATSMLACGTRRLPAPAYTGQPQEALVQVPYPPPPARVEYVPEQPNGAAVWVDGEWVWRGRRYAWKPGRWVKPPANASFAPWATVRDPMGTLYIAEGTWRDSKGNQVAAPTPIETGAPSPGVVTDPEGDTVSESPIQSPDASLTKSESEATKETTRAPENLIVDGGDFRPDAGRIPDSSVPPSDASLIPDAAGFDARFDAQPARIGTP